MNAIDARLLGDQLLDPQMSVRERALDALGKLAEEKPGDAALQAQRAAENLRVPLVRARAIATLGRLGAAGAAYAEEIVVFLTDSDLEVRLAVGSFLRAARDHIKEDVVARVVEVLLRDPSDRFRATAAVAVGSLGASKAAAQSAVLQKMLRENVCGETGFSPALGAAIGLGRLGDKGEVLAAHLVSIHPEMRAAVCQGFSEMGLPAAPYEARVRELLDDPVDGVRAMAARALESMGISSQRS